MQDIHRSPRELLKAAAVGDLLDDQILDLADEVEAQFVPAVDVVADDREQQPPDEIIAEHDEPAPPVAWTAEELADCSDLSPTGYVRCFVPPWDSLRDDQIGRITVWPSNAPPASQNVQANCFLHRACRTPAMNRLRATDRDLMVWIFSAVIEPKCTHARLVELRKMHSDCLLAIVPK